MSTPPSHSLSVTAPGNANHADWTLFGSTTGWLDEGTPGFDLRTGRPVLPDDHDEPYWREHGYGGTGQFVCPRLLSVSSPTSRPRRVCR